MATLIGILDRNWWGSRTDINVLVNPQTRTLTWIPRDMYVESIKNRINSVFFMGGDHTKYRAAAAELGLQSDYSIVVLPSASSKALENVSVTVRVPYEMKFKYPLRPLVEMHLGERIIEFHPPSETLEGERIHQWIGAREWVGPSRPPTQDLYRILRQQSLVQQLLRQNFDFNLVPTEGISVSDPKAFDDLKLINPNWQFKCLDKATVRVIDGMAVLVKHPYYRFPYYQYPCKWPR